MPCFLAFGPRDWKRLQEKWAGTTWLLKRVQNLRKRLVLMSRQYGIEPQQLLQMLQQNNQLPAMFADVRRGLTVAAVVHGATVTDTEGNTIDTTEFFGPSDEQAAAPAGEAEAAGDEDEEAAETPQVAAEAAADDDDSK